MIVRFALAALVAFGSAFASTSDSNVYAPPDYYTMLPPLDGGSYTDPVFGTSIKRITNARAAISADSGTTLPWIEQEYSTMSPFNPNNTLLLLIHVSYFALYDGSGHFLRDLPREVNASSQPRWSRRVPYIFYYIRGNELRQYNVFTSAISVVHTFSEYSSIDGKGESDISFDGDHFVFAGDNRYVFVYQISTDSKVSTFDTGGRGFDSLYITPNDNVTITWFQNGPNRYNGIELFDRNMNFQRQLTQAGGHMDVTRDTNGDEVLIWPNAADPAYISENGIVKVRLSDGHQTTLVTFDWSLAVHVSAPDSSGWAFVETYAPGDPGPNSSGWKPYTNELLQIKLDGTEVRRLAH
ncbi:MAG: hypothetical protein DMG07_27530 [Acidobacteria bacterium]|nr:MAG: hypothetical protein DMG07_27530 [Acidobacteriota bacterium]